jgi:hypothetical protein
MALNEKTVFADLAPFSKMVVDAGKGILVSDTTFASASDLWSTGVFLLATSALTGGQTVKLFSVARGQSGQGTTASHTYQQTNVVFNNGQMSANQTYLGIKTGFTAYWYTTPDTLSIPQYFDGLNDLLAVTNDIVWKLKVGDNIQRTIGTLADYPQGNGVWGFPSAAGTSSPQTQTYDFQQNGGPISTRRPLPLPVIWPPLVQVDIELEVGQTNTLTGATAAGAAAIKQTFEGYLMTLPTVGG